MTPPHTNLGRPTIGPPVKVRLDEALLARIDDLAEFYGVSRAEAVRRLLAAGLDAAEGGYQWS